MKIKRITFPIFHIMTIRGQWIPIQPARISAFYWENVGTRKKFWESVGPIMVQYCVLAGNSVTYNYVATPTSPSSLAKEMLFNTPSELSCNCRHLTIANFLIIFYPLRYV